jgi:chromosomal replication initiation ATPase DnaA
MLNKEYKLRKNPFYHKFIRNEREIEKFPFVETQSYKRILREINLFYQNNPDEFLSFLGVVVGSTGSGKTTCMLKIQKELKNQHKSVAFINVLKKSPAFYYRFITGSYSAYSSKFKENWTTNNSVLIFDVPDGAKSRQIAKIVDVIQQVFSEYHTSMIND